jgi:lysozyme
MNHVPRDASALPPVLDIEWNHKSRTCRRFPDPETVRAEARSFLQLLTARYGKRPLIYTTVDFYRDNELWKLDGHHFWLRSVAGHPADVYPGQRWAFWQYTGTGVVEGIAGPTDLNVFGGSRAQWMAWATAAR